MSEIESKVKAIIVDKLGVDEAEYCTRGFLLVFLFHIISPEPSEQSIR